MCKIHPHLPSCVQCWYILPALGFLDPIFLPALLLYRSKAANTGLFGPFPGVPVARWHAAFFLRCGPGWNASCQASGRQLGRPEGERFGRSAPWALLGERAPKKNIFFWRRVNTKESRKLFLEGFWNIEKGGSFCPFKHGSIFCNTIFRGSD